MKKVSQKICSIVSLNDMRDFHRNIFPKTGLVCKDHFNRKKNAMFLVLDNDKHSVCLQGKVEEHADGQIKYTRMDITSMKKLMLETYRKEKDFQKGIDKKTGKPLFWITDTKSKSKRQPIHIQPVRAYKKVMTTEGEQAVRVDDVFVNFNDIAKVFVD